MSGSTITGTVTMGITLGSAGYYSPLTVEQTGRVNPSQSTVAGVLVDNGLLTNNGTIVGGGAYYQNQRAGNGVDVSGGEVVNAGLLQGGSSDVAFTSGAGIDVSGGTLSNDGTIIGGEAAFSSGDGMTFSEGMVFNAGTIAGNVGYSFRPAIYGVYGGTGIVMYGGTLTNTTHGLITGANGGPGGTGGQGGYGVTLAGGTFINEGTVAGGSGGNSGEGYSYGPGGNGFKVTGGVLTNDGTISGGVGGYPGHTHAEAPGNGVDLEAGFIVNNGLITGGEGFDRGNADGFNGGIGVYLNAGTLVNDGTIAGGLDTQGRRSDAMMFGTGASTLVVEPSATFFGDVLANSTASDTLELSGNATVSVGALDMGGSFSGFSTIAFDANATWQLRGTKAELAAGQVIDGFTFQDTIFLDGLVATSYTYSSGTGLEISSPTAEETLDIIGGFSTSSFLVASAGSETEVELLCYLRGTRILTPAGEVPVERLALGDPVVTRFGGYQKIKWIGRQSFTSRFIRNNQDKIPVRIRPAALGNSLPKRDLYISPGHSMLLGGTLVLARDLVNGVTVTQDDLTDEIDYYQLEFETHDCVLAEGSWSESFCDFGSLRNQFHNVAEFWQLYPKYRTPEEHIMCAPRLESGPTLDAVLKPIIERAAARVPLGPLQGVIDEVQPSGLIRGWAIDVAHPELPVLLEILLDGRVLSSILACGYRPDLAAAGLGRGRCGFTFEGSTIDPESLLNICVRRFDTDNQLPFGQHCLATVENVSKLQRKRA